MSRSPGIFVLSAACLMLLPPAVSGQTGSSDSLSVEVISLAALKEIIRHDSGKVVLVNAWATWCKPCMKEMPALVRIRKKLSAKPFELILVSADDTDLAPTAVRSALEKAGVAFRTYLMQDQGDEAFINGMNPEWGGTLPASFVYDRKGQQQEMFVGARTYEQFRDAIRKVLPPD